MSRPSHSARTKVLFVASECYPLVKTGGLADVVGALPVALAPLGTDVRIVLPGYRGMRALLSGVRTVAKVPDLFGGDGALLQGTTAQGLTVMLVEAPHLFHRDGGPYLAPGGNDWPDNHLRFGALSWVAAQIALGRLGPWQPDVVHLHDWQAALTAAYLHFDPAGSTAPPTLLTIHNLAFQGLFPADTRAALRLPAAALDLNALEYWGRLSFLKAGVQFCSRLTTVSPTYAREILAPDDGMGFDGLLRARASQLSGIVNGIDTDVWNPATDTHLAVNYSARTASARARNTSALQRELGLEVTRSAPLFGVVSRLTHQKGLDLLIDALHAIIEGGGQLAVLGTGDRALESAFRAAALRHPGRVASVIGFDEGLSHRIQAGADAMLVPSRFEPCGLTQLCALRYGAIPVVARVGGLADTVIDANEAALFDGVATGVQFSPVDTAPLADAITRTIALYRQPAVWRQLRKRAMTRTVGWAPAAARYFSLYEQLLAEHAG